MIGSLTVSYIELDQAVVHLAADIPDHDVGETLDLELKKSRRFFAIAQLRQRKREKAITQLYEALCAGELIALVRDPASGTLIRLIGADWRTATFWRDSILGGAVRGSIGEHIARYDGGQVLLETDSFTAWLNKLAKEPHDAPAADDEARCLAWLEGEMRKSPEQKPCPKKWWREKAKTDFNVSWRAFDRLWDIAIKETGSSWNRHGAPAGPRKSKQIIEAPK